MFVILKVFHFPLTFQNVHVFVSSYVLSTFYQVDFTIWIMLYTLYLQEASEKEFSSNVANNKDLTKLI